ncbi:MAG: hypothetical protein L0215_14835, partial [Gemmataceae bacterium]|nr:hypothetical protein [Gemmataceae bacterium]
MAIATEPSSFNPAETQRRVRHPLETLRGKIRLYVTLEGIAVAVIFLALASWIGLFFDYGLFAAFAFDWVQELQEATADVQSGATGSADVIVRSVLLAGLLVALVALVLWKLVFRINREFSYSALALVLERRFPRELGDRLITAVEMADPKQAEKYGYSAALVQKTIEDAAERVEKLPVGEAFNWRRLYGLGGWCLGLTLGLYLLVGVVSCAVGGLTGGSASPWDYLWRSGDVSGIWAERNLFVMDSYWPRSAYLELVRFQDTKERKGEMRVPRDEQRPDVLVRSVEWVVADRAGHGGWRSLRWSDLGRFVDKALLERVAIPSDWGGWLVDLDDLDPSVPPGVLPPAWQGKTTGEVRKELSNAKVEAGLKRLGADQAAHALLDWRTWTVDKIKLQKERGEIRRAMREQFPQAHEALEEVYTQLAMLAGSSANSRRLRKLEIPIKVHFLFRGETRNNADERSLMPDNKYTIPLNELKESARLTVRGNDYYTPSRRITLVPPPSLKFLAVDKEEPAYIYYRLQGDQTPLKGKKQIFTKHPISVTGDISIIQVPLGTNLSLYAESDRPLQDGIRLRPPAGADERGAQIPDVPVVLASDGTSFRMSLKNVTRTYEFYLEFLDQDNVKGRRRIKIQPIDDRPPEVFDVELEVVLRKPRFKTEGGRAATGPADGFLITPDAILPYKGTLRD